MISFFFEIIIFSTITVYIENICNDDSHFQSVIFISLRKLYITPFVWDCILQLNT